MFDLFRSSAEAATPAADAERVATAACAILHALALSDGDEAPVEREAIRHARRDRFRLDEALIERVEAAASKATTDLYAAAATVRDGWHADERRQVVEAMRDVIWADGRIGGHERRLSRSVGSLLGLPPDEVWAVLSAAEA